MRVAFRTFGCKANFVDTDSLHSEAKKKGFDIVDEHLPADAYVINSCTVTAAADKDARTEAVRFKRLNPNAIVAVIGCYSQVAKEELLELPEIDLVSGTADKLRILDLIRNSQNNKPLERDYVVPANGFLPESFNGSRRARPSIKVQDGCNFSCTFCIIPTARGRSRSTPVETVLKMVNSAYAQGYREVTLTGIHLAHYGWDRGTDLMELLKRLLDGPGPRIRLSTLDPFEIPDELIALVESFPRLCPHYHIAIQSGSDEVLSKMRRIYRAEEFVEVTQKIRSANPRTFIGVDVIVGFPGEGLQQYEETLQCLERSWWTKLHVFPYSERAGTPAEKLDQKVSQEEKNRRSKELRDWSDRRLSEFMDSEVGKPCEVILERESEKHPGMWKGHTENYLPTLSRAPLRQYRELIPSFIEGKTGDRIITAPREIVFS